MSWVIAMGNIADGIILIGPFESYTHARVWKDDHDLQGHIMAMKRPTTPSLHVARRTSRLTR